MIKVIDWVDSSEELESFKKCVNDEYKKAVVGEIVSHKYCFSGYKHQNLLPKFNDGSIGFYSHLGWGEIMANAWNFIHKTDIYNYRDFSYNIPFSVVEKLPKEK